MNFEVVRHRLSANICLLSKNQQLDQIPLRQVQRGQFPIPAAQLQPLITLPEGNIARIKIVMYQRAWHLLYFAAPDFYAGYP
ncbi:hypothetical protein D3C75_1163960 [compost metagenome]